MPELGPHFEYTCELLADRLVTPERYGKVAGDGSVQLELPDNLVLGVE